MLISLLIMEEKSSATELGNKSSRLISFVESPDSERLIVLIWQYRRTGTIIAHQSVQKDVKFCSCIITYVLPIGSNSCSNVVKYGSFLYGPDDCFNLRILPVCPSDSVFAALLSNANVRWYSLAALKPFFWRSMPETILAPCPVSWKIALFFLLYITKNLQLSKPGTNLSEPLSNPALV